ncbi:MAG: 50S ribosomal protein L4 [Porphyromonas sp.]|uniref:Large ribosomal subunit protein uL4 n=1 Tax=Porphyromonas uenonis 60-3 TaxID=596327 RepID=C2MCH7_9PORP|nr:MULTISPECIES: 50S ribosomal protein L4 [Porphyromonas]EEK16597.1 50S ribosomal protein L4 [Porphyromonas uenonis 60-3]MDD6927883.1 50S ribosomal protein L4 [Bacteroidales bacterium]MDY3111813.1 50S ribosomal protein L4 [Porphyromonas sp.]MDY4245541.1 50S ribosomal protein L4 [Porphyromonas sp.]
MELSIYNIQGEDTGRKIALESSVFGIEPNDHAIYLTVKQYRANQRQGTHKTKERSEMSGSTRKLFRQKGTGGARRGDINSNILRGGARVFGPRPRSYSFKLNKKLRQLARRSALTYKAQDNQIMVLDQLSFEAPKTKSFVSMAKALNVDGQKTLYVVSQIEDTVALSARNIPGVSIIRAQDLNTYCVLDCRKIVFTEDALAQVNEMF